jgi:hypothetical protein
MKRELGKKEKSGLDGLLERYTKPDFIYVWFDFWDIQEGRQRR